MLPPRNGSFLGLLAILALVTPSFSQIDDSIVNSPPSLTLPSNSFNDNNFNSPPGRNSRSETTQDFEHRADRNTAGFGSGRSSDVPFVTGFTNEHPVIRDNFNSLDSPSINVGNTFNGFPEQSLNRGSGVEQGLQRQRQNDQFNQFPESFGFPAAGNNENVDNFIEPHTNEMVQGFGNEQFDAIERSRPTRNSFNEDGNGQFFSSNTERNGGGGFSDRPRQNVDEFDSFPRFNNMDNLDDNFMGNGVRQEENEKQSLNLPWRTTRNERNNEDNPQFSSDSQNSLNTINDSFNSESDVIGGVSVNRGNRGRRQRHGQIESVESPLPFTARRGGGSGKGGATMPRMSRNDEENNDSLQRPRQGTVEDLSLLESQSTNNAARRRPSSKTRNMKQQRGQETAKKTESSKNSSKRERNASRKSAKENVVSEGNRQNGITPDQNDLTGASFSNSPRSGLNSRPSFSSDGVAPASKKQPNNFSKSKSRQGQAPNSSSNAASSKSTNQPKSESKSSKQPDPRVAESPKAKGGFEGGLPKSSTNAASPKSTNQPKSDSKSPKQSESRIAESPKAKEGSEGKSPKDGGIFIGKTGENIQNQEPPVAILPPPTARPKLDSAVSSSEKGLHGASGPRLISPIFGKKSPAPSEAIGEEDRAFLRGGFKAVETISQETHRKRLPSIKLDNPLDIDRSENIPKPGSGPIEAEVRGNRAIVINTGRKEKDDWVPSNVVIPLIENLPKEEGESGKVEGGDQMPEKRFPGIIASPTPIDMSTKKLWPADIRLNIPFATFVTDSMLAAQAFSILPLELSESLNIPSERMQVVQLREDLEDENATIVSIAFDEEGGKNEEKLSKLSELVQDGDSNLYTNANHAFSRFFDPGFPVTKAESVLEATEGHSLWKVGGAEPAGNYYWMLAVSISGALYFLLVGGIVMAWWRVSRERKNALSERQSVLG